MSFLKKQIENVQMGKIKQLKVKIILVSIFISFLNGQTVAAGGGDILDETPLYPVPTEMTYEEYKDMNRRINVAIGWSTIPIPGITHYYANEKKMAKSLLYIGLGGAASIILGAAMNGEPSWPDTSSSELRDLYAVYNTGTNDESWYRKIPITMEGDQTHYKLEKINKESDNAGGAFIFAGFLILVGDFIYDRLWGLRKIEEKRDTVRFKYGQQLRLSLVPDINPFAKNAGLSLNLYF